ncbi:MAG: AAA family ATPase [bacterium]
MVAIKEWADRVISSVEGVFYGKRSVVEQLIVALLARGHVLIEDIPGVGKTILARSLAASISATFARIQCTPDLLPADVLGVSVYNPKDQEFHYKEGPILRNFLLVDELNRATPRTQSALLEAMGEGQITTDGVRRPLPDPFFVMATENPVEFEGTFPLPEAQKDRFLLSVSVGYPEADVEAQILESQRRITHPLTDVEAVATLEELRAHQEKVVTIHVEDAVRDYMLALVAATRSHSATTAGVSPRGSLALYRSCQARAALSGRDFVTPDDVKALAPAVFAKRLILTSAAEIRGVTAALVASEVLESTRVPVFNADA